MGSGSSLISGTQYVEYLTEMERKVWSQKSNSRVKTITLIPFI
jgi:hypothetical protein